MRNTITRQQDADEQQPVDPRHVDLPFSVSEVWRISMRGSRPSWIACWVREKAPVITAWLAMTVAIVASATMGRSAQPG